LSAEALEESQKTLASLYRLWASRTESPVLRKWKERTRKEGAGGPLPSAPAEDKLPFDMRETIFCSTPPKKQQEQNVRSATPLPPCGRGNTQGMVTPVKEGRQLHLLASSPLTSPSSEEQGLQVQGSSGGREPDETPPASTKLQTRQEDDESLCSTAVPSSTPVQEFSASDTDLSPALPCHEASPQPGQQACEKSDSPSLGADHKSNSERAEASSNVAPTISTSTELEATVSEAAVCQEKRPMAVYGLPSHKEVAMGPMSQRSQPLLKRPHPGEGPAGPALPAGPAAVPKKRLRLSEGSRPIEAQPQAAEEALPSSSSQASQVNKPPTREHPEAAAPASATRAPEVARFPRDSLPRRAKGKRRRFQESETEEPMSEQDDAAKDDPDEYKPGEESSDCTEHGRKKGGARKKRPGCAQKAQNPMVAFANQHRPKRGRPANKETSATLGGYATASQATSTRSNTLTGAAQELSRRSEEPRPVRQDQACLEPRPIAGQISRIESHANAS